MEGGPVLHSIRMAEEGLREEIQDLRGLHEHNFVEACLTDELVENEPQVIEGSPWGERS